MPHYTPDKINCTCEQCGKPFTRYPSEIKRGYGKYCCRACMDIGRQNLSIQICEQCKNEFRATGSAKRRNPGRFCSRECLFQSMRTRIDCVCLQCGNAFTTLPKEIKKGAGKYCSNECRGLALRGENSPHWRGGHDSYRGENWMHQRQLAWKRDKGICQHCGKKSKKRKHDVHHIRPFRLYNGDYVAANELTNLITLCQTCHKLAEHGSIEIQPYLL